MQARIEELLQERKAQSLTAVLSLEAELADARSALAQVPTTPNCWDLNANQCCSAHLHIECMGCPRVCDSDAAFVPGSKCLHL